MVALAGWGNLKRNRQSARAKGRSGSTTRARSSARRAGSSALRGASDGVAKPTLFLGIESETSLEPEGSDDDR